MSNKSRKMLKYSIKNINTTFIIIYILWSTAGFRDSYISRVSTAGYID